MMLDTKHFGEIEVDADKVIAFPEGLPGFEDVRKFVLLGNEENADTPFRWLQSVDRPELAFVVVDPFLIRKDYDIEIPDETCRKLGIRSIEDIQLLSIVVVPADYSQMSINLKAPIIININNRKGLQFVLDTDIYGVRHYISEELRRREARENACSYEEKRPVYSYR